MTQPIEMRINEMISGVRSDVACILFGDDYEVMGEKAQEVERILRSIEGSADVTIEPFTGQPMVEIQIDQEAIARYGVPARAVLDIVESLGTFKVRRRVPGPASVSPSRFACPMTRAATPRQFANIPIATAAGEQIPLSRLADVFVVEGPSTIKREWYQRRLAITTNVRGRDMGTFVAEAEQKIHEQVQMPSSRYRVQWGGQFEHLESAQRRLMIVVPLALILIFTLLYVTYENMIDGHPRLHRRSVRVDGRHLCAVDTRHAVLDIGGDRFCGPFRRRRTRRHAAPFRRFGNSGRKAWSWRKQLKRPP